MKLKFYYYYFSIIGEAAIYSAYMALFLSEMKNYSDSQIASLLSVGFIVIILVGPFLGKLIDRLENVTPLFVFSIVAYTVSMFGFYYVENIAFMYLFFGLFQLAKMPLLTMGDVNAMEANSMGLLNYGKARSYGALGYAILPLIISMFFSVFFASQVQYHLLFILMNVIVISNGYLNYKMSKQMKHHRKIEQTKVRTKLSPAFKKKLAFYIFSSAVLMIPLGISGSVHALYLNEIIGTAALIGVVIFCGSIFEWPLMQMSNNLLEKIGMHNGFLILAILSIARWVLYTISGSYGSVILLLIGSTMNGFMMAIYLPMSMKYLKHISPTGNFAYVLSLQGAIISGLNWAMFQVAGYVMELYSIQALFASFIVVSSLWLVFLVCTRKTNIYSLEGE